MVDKKIAILCCSEAQNIGNNFINSGGKRLLAQVLARAKIPASIMEFEIFDSCASGAGFEYPSPSLSKSSKDYINGCDLIVAFGGSILNTASNQLLNEIAALRPPKILIGVSAAGFCDIEMPVVRKAVSDMDVMFMRDYLTSHYFGLENEKSVRQGIDLAFFVDTAAVPRERGQYAVLNIDPFEPFDPGRDRYFSLLQSRFDEVYLTDNSTVPRKDTKGYVCLGSWHGFYSLYANAAYVVTTRVHTSVVCVTNNTPFLYVGPDKHHPNGKRLALFERIGLTIKTGMEFSREELAGYQMAIEVARDDMRRQLADVFGRFLHA